MKCPNCLSPKIIPTNDLPAAFRPSVWGKLLPQVRCETCLTVFYRVRGTNLLIRRGTANCVPFL